MRAGRYACFGGVRPAQRAPRFAAFIPAQSPAGYPLESVRSVRRLLGSATSGLPSLRAGHGLFAQCPALPRLGVPSIPVFRHYLAVLARWARPATPAIRRLSVGIPAPNWISFLAFELDSGSPNLLHSGIHTTRRLRVPHDLGASA